MGAAVFGALFGPVVGALAAETGRAAVFCGVSVLAGVLAATTLTIASHAPERPSLAALRRAASNSHFRGGLGLLALGSLLAGVLSVLSPLHLTHAGWGPSAIGAVWLVAAALEAVESPLIGQPQRPPRHPRARALRPGRGRPGLASADARAGAAPVRPPDRRRLVRVRRALHPRVRPDRRRRRTQRARPGDGVRDDERRLGARRDGRTRSARACSTARPAKRSRSCSRPWHAWARSRC